jgi:hypothetical protein
MWSENVRTVRDCFQMYMRPKAEQYFRGEMFVNLKISTITGVFTCFYLANYRPTRNFLFLFVPTRNLDLKLLKMIFFIRLLFVVATTNQVDRVMRFSIGCFNV